MKNLDGSSASFPPGCLQPGRLEPEHVEVSVAQGEGRLPELRNVRKPGTVADRFEEHDGSAGTHGNVVDKALADVLPGLRLVEDTVGGNGPVLIRQGIVEGRLHARCRDGGSRQGAIEVVPKGTIVEVRTEHVALRVGALLESGGVAAGDRAGGQTFLSSERESLESIEGVWGFPAGDHRAGIELLIADEAVGIGDDAMIEPDGDVDRQQVLLR